MDNFSPSLETAGDRVYRPVHAYVSRRGEWGRTNVKVLHRLVKNGNSVQVTIPAAMLADLKWRAGTAIVIELTVAGTVEVRKPTMADVHNVNLPQPFELTT